MRKLPATRLAIPCLLLLGCSGDLEVTPLYNPANGRVVIAVNQDITGKDLFVRVRRGSFGTLDCKKMTSELEQVSDLSGSRIDGPFVDPPLTQPFYNGAQWLNPTPEMLAQIKLGTDSIIDVCLMDGSDVVVQMERDLSAPGTTRASKASAARRTTIRRASSGSTARSPTASAALASSATFHSSRRPAKASTRRTTASSRPRFR